MAVLPSQINDCARTPSVISSTYFRNFEVIYQTTSGRLKHVLYDQKHEVWIAREEFGPIDVDGVAGFIQINDGAPGNFEVVIRRATGVLENWYRDNTANAASWQRKHTFGSGILKSGAALVQRWHRNFGAPDVTGGLYGQYWRLPAGLDLVCVTNENTLQRWWRDDPNTAGWVACETFASDVDSPPVMIRSAFGSTDETVPGNYELAVAVDGAIQHWWMPGVPEPTNTANWNLGQVFGTNVPGQQVLRVLGLMQSSYGFNLEVFAELANGHIQHFSQDGSGWHARAIVGFEV